MKGTKFITNAVNKQDMAYNAEWAEKQFAYSCEKCASCNILNMLCDRCPIKVAHVRAIKEIEQGIRQKPRSWDRGVRVNRDRHGHITLTLNNCQGITININGEEVNIDK